jgi:hypothetical protein
MAKFMEKDSTLADVAATMKNADVYVANIWHLMKRAGGEANRPVAVRVGVTGKGLHPSFRLETLDGKFIESYDGQTFRPFEERNSHLENWSSKSAASHEVKELLEKMRNIKSKKA